MPWSKPIRVRIVHQRRSNSSSARDKSRREADPWRLRGAQPVRESHVEIGRGAGPWRPPDCWQGGRLPVGSVHRQAISRDVDREVQGAWRFSRRRRARVCACRRCQPPGHFVRTGPRIIVRLTPDRTIGRNATLRQTSRARRPSMSTAAAVERQGRLGCLANDRDGLFALSTDQAGVTWCPSLPLFRRRT